MTSQTNEQRGWTLIELLMVLAALASIALAGLAVWAIIHFVAKYW